VAKEAVERSQKTTTKAEVKHKKFKTEAEEERADKVRNEGIAQMQEKQNY